MSASARFRIIPARAGFTTAQSPDSVRPWDHPRSRGVYSSGVTLYRVEAGSSPLARGLRIGSICTGLGRRIIPARAGFTRPLDITGRAVPDHPRSRGVYAAAPGRGACTPGSSPLARGLHHRHRHHRPGPGIIPARAGFTHRGRTSWRRRGDHPRSRGVYSSALPVISPISGSSPLARGLPDHFRRMGRDQGIIPARAGFTAGGAAGGLRGGDHPRSRGVYRQSAQDRSA